MTDARPGDIVEIWEGGSILSAVLLALEKGRWRVVTESGQILRVAPSRIAHRAGHAGADPAGAAAAAAAHGRETATRASGMDVASLWEILVDAGGRHTAAALAELAFGDSAPASTSAVIRRLSFERAWFERKGDLWVARSREAVEETGRRVKIEQERERRRSAFLERMRTRTRSHAGPGAPAFTEEDRAYLDKIVDLAIHGDESVTRKEAVALLDELGSGGPIAGVAAFELLVRAGVFAQDENLEILRFELRTDFPAEVREAAERAVQRPAQEARTALEGLHILTVDDPETAEVDDGLSWRVGEGGLDVLGIHIADPSEFTRPGDLIDEEALRRAATYYFPERRLNMLPPLISERAASLEAGADRPALSFFLHVDAHGEVRRFEILPSRIRASARLSYEETDALLEGGEERPGETGQVLARLARVASAMRARRVEAGAVILRAPEVSVKVDTEGHISVRRTSERGISRELVAEMMIQVNAHCAGFCATHDIPAIYRRQPPPQAPIEPFPDGPYDPVALRTARRGLRRGEVGLSPDVHFALGVPAYMQITSPLRRYQDLAAVRQIKAWLRGEPLPYDAEALARIAATTEAAERAARHAENAASTYWLLKHLEGLRGREVEAVVIHVEARRSAVELCETLHVCGIPARPDHVPGLRLKLVIEEVRPRLGSIRLRQAG